MLLAMHTLGQKLGKLCQNLGVDHFLDNIGPFEAPWWPFWILEVLIEGVIKT